MLRYRTSVGDRVPSNLLLQPGRLVDLATAPLFVATLDLVNKLPPPPEQVVAGRRIRPETP